MVKKRASSPMGRKRILWWQKLVILLLALIGVAAISYPFMSSFLNSLAESAVISDYMAETGNVSEDESAELLAEAAEYNATLLTSTAVMTEPFSEEAILDALDGYYDILNISTSGVFGYIDISAIDVHLPVYHGTSSDILERGVGHLQGSSFPIGGDSTHSILCAHSGLATSTLFTHLDQVETGDIFSITVLHQTIYYEVCEIQIVLPEEVSALLNIQTGRDLVTLMTCTPYGVNTHRLLVTGERIGTPQEEIAAELPEATTEPDGQVEGEPTLLYICETVGGMLLVAAAALFTYSYNRTKNKEIACYDEENET